MINISDNVVKEQPKAKSAGMAESHEDVLQALNDAQKGFEFSIIKISEPILTAINQSSATRTSDVSNDGLDCPTPASLEADLTHYKVCLAVDTNAKTVLKTCRNCSQSYVSRMSNK